MLYLEIPDLFGQLDPAGLHALTLRNRSGDKQFYNRYYKYNLSILYNQQMDNRPIKGNKSGKYTFVLDPTNDIASYYNGMTDLEEAIDKYFTTLEYKPGLRQGAAQSTLFDKKENEKFKFVDVCSVCLVAFKDREQIKMLECHHCFHKDCVVNWFSQQLTCPNCRFSLAVHNNNSFE